VIEWCRECGKDIRWDAGTLERSGKCACSRWTIRITTGKAYQALHRRRQFFPASFEIKSPAPRGGRSRARRHKRITNEAN